MLAAGWGRIISISSSQALRPRARVAPYAASKAALIGFTKAFALEVARSGITVNAIAPSVVDTAMPRENSSEERLREQARDNPTAGGDAPEGIVLFYEAFSADGCQPSHLPLFSRREENLAAVILEQDVIYVGGGNTANMLAIWRAHGVDKLLRQAWDNGIVLC